MSKETVQQEKSYKYLFEVEELAQDILTSKEEKLQIANTQNKLREALRALEQVEDRKTWMQMGPVYIQRSTEDTKKILNDELAKAELDLNELHNSIREKTQRLRDLEHEPRLEGFTLKPMSVAEAKALHKGDMAPTKVAAGLVVYRKLSGKIEYLLLQTSYGIHHWTPPKGHVDPGESIMETALRETKEESGLEPSDLKILDEFEIKSEYLINTTVKRVHYWIAEMPDPSTPVRLSDEHQDYKWADLEEACRLVEFKETQSLLKKCDEYLKSL